MSLTPILLSFPNKLLYCTVLVLIRPSWNCSVYASLMMQNIGMLPAHLLCFSIFLQREKSTWPPSRVQSISVTTCPRTPSRAVAMRLRSPSRPCSAMDWCSTPENLQTTSTWRWRMVLSRWSSTWALGPSRPWWSPSMGNLMTMPGMMWRLPGTFVR